MEENFSLAQGEQSNPLTIVTIGWPGHTRKAAGHLQSGVASEEEPGSVPSGVLGMA